MDFKRVAIEILDECDRSPASLKSILREIEREAVLAALNEKKNISRAAVALRLNRTTVMEMLKRLGIKASQSYRVERTFTLEGTNERSNQSLREIQI